MKSNSGFYFISSLVSLGLYYIAPNQVDYSFQIICFLIFLVQAIFIIREDIRKDGLLNFNFMFLFSFFLVTYAFPLFLMGVTMIQREGIEAFIDFNVSSKCSALCTFAISVYFWAYKHRRRTKADLSKIIKAPGSNALTIFYYLIFIFLFNHTMSHMLKHGGVAVESGFWYSLYLACLPLCLVMNCHKYKVKNLAQFIKQNILILLPASILMLLYIIIGDRGMIIVGGVIIIAVYHFMVKHLSARLLVAGIIVGSTLMYAIRETRDSDMSLSEGGTGKFLSGAEGALAGASTLSIFSDLTGIHRELYIGYYYVQHHGLVEPWQILIVPFYPLPLVPNLMSQALFNKSMDEIKPGLVLNDYMYYSGHGNFGTHCVIDLYMRWGILGVFFFFYLWGYMVSSISRTQRRNVMGMVLYVMLIASAVSLPRQPILDMLRMFAYILFLAWGSALFSKKKKSINLK